MSIEYTIPFIFDSGSNDANNISSDGSSFWVNLETPLAIPHNASYCFITVPEATVWNNISNVTTDVNDRWYVHYDGNDVQFTIDEGLWDTEHLNAAIKRELANNPLLPSDLFSVIPDTATSKIVIQFNYIDTQIDFTQTDTMREMLGFDSQLVPAALTTAPIYITADNTAAFNNLDWFTIGSDLVTRGIRVNSRYDQTLIKIPVIAAPGSQINFHPQNPPRIPAQELIGTRRKSFQLWLTNNNLQRVNTNNESFSVSVNIHYVIENNKKILDY